MSRKDVIAAISSRYKTEVDELEAEILRSEERLSALKSLLAARKGEKTEIETISADIS